MKQKQLTPQERSEIIFAFTKELAQIRRLSKQYGVSRQAIYKLLKKKGIDTKSSGIITVKCNTCGAEISRHRCRVRKQKNHFCDQDCNASFLKANIGRQKMARLKVSEYFKLESGNIVHFDDGIDWNTNIYNLAVFKNQKEHILYHHNKSTKPIWRIK